MTRVDSLLHAAKLLACLLLLVRSQSFSLSSFVMASTPKMQSTATTTRSSTGSGMEEYITTLLAESSRTANELRGSVSQMRLEVLWEASRSVAQRLSEGAYREMGVRAAGLQRDRYRLLQTLMNVSSLLQKAAAAAEEGGRGDPMLLSEEQQQPSMELEKKAIDVLRLYQTSLREKEEKDTDGQQNPLDVDQEEEAAAVPASSPRRRPHHVAEVLADVLRSFAEKEEGPSSLAIPLVPSPAGLRAFSREAIELAGLHLKYGAGGSGTGAGHAEKTEGSNKPLAAVDEGLRCLWPRLLEGRQKPALRLPLFMSWLQEATEVDAEEGEKVSEPASPVELTEEERKANEKVLLSRLMHYLDRLWGLQEEETAAASAALQSPVSSNSAGEPPLTLLRAGSEAIKRRRRDEEVAVVTHAGQGDDVDEEGELLHSYLHAIKIRTVVEMVGRWMAYRHALRRCGEDTGEMAVMLQHIQQMPLWLTDVTAWEQGRLQAPQHLPMSSTILCLPGLQGLFFSTAVCMGRALHSHPAPLDAIPASLQCCAGLWRYLWEYTLQVKEGTDESGQSGPRLPIPVPVAEAWLQRYLSVLPMRTALHHHTLIPVPLTFEASTSSSTTALPAIDDGSDGGDPFLPPAEARALRHRERTIIQRLWTPTSSTNGRG